jgi:hypothetical protein
LKGLTNHWGCLSQLDRSKLVHLTHDVEQKRRWADYSEGVATRVRYRLDATAGRSQGTAQIPSCVVPEHHFRITIAIDFYTVAAMLRGGQGS